MNRDMEKISDKIKKLLALAKNNANEHERAVALSAAQKLMDEYNVSVVASSEEEQKIGRELHELGRERWQMALTHAVSRLYYCSMHQSGSTHVIVGTEANRAAVLQITTWLKASIAKEAKLTFDFKADRRDFCLGAVVSIGTRITEILDKEKQEEQVEKLAGGTSNKFSIVHLRQTANDKIRAYMAEEGIKLDKARASNVKVGTGYSEGRTWGNSVNLDKQTKHARIG